MKKTITLLAFIVVVVFGVVALSQQSVPEMSDYEQVVDTPVTIAIEGGETREIEITRDETILSVLRRIDDMDPVMDLVVTEYAGIGTLVTGMYGRVNGTDDQYWQYTVDGVVPLIGAQAYKLSGNERIEWRFTQSAS